MARRVPETIERDSTAASVDSIDGGIVADDSAVSQRGIRGGYGAVIMPAITQYVLDSYLSEQTDGVALVAPWLGDNDVVRDENAFVGDLSVELDGTGTDATAYQKGYDHDNEIVTTSAYIYAPPPFNLASLKMFTGNVGAVDSPTGIISLGDYRYFVWFTGEAGVSVNDLFGVHIENDDNPIGSVWVDCMTVTESEAPVNFIPNNSEIDYVLTSDDKMKLALEVALPQSGTIDFTYIPFFDNTNKAIDTAPTILTFLTAGGNIGSNDYVTIKVDDTNSRGIYLVKKVGAGGEESTGDTGFAGTGFKAFEPVQVTIIWDFTGSGTNQVKIFINGVLEIESGDLTNWPTGLIDIWIGVTRSAASTYIQHGQCAIQDIQIFRRIA